MPLHRLLERASFHPEDIKVIAAAIESVCRSLDLKPRDPRREQVARKVFECAQRGERSLDGLKQAGLDGGSR